VNQFIGMPQERDIYLLLTQYFQGTLEKENLRYLEDWKANHPVAYQDMLHIWQESNTKSPTYHEEINFQKLNQRIDALEAENDEKKHRLSKRYLTLAASISFLLIAVFGLFYKMYDATAKEDEQVQWIEKSTQRSQIATFTLLDGTKVKLNADSKFRYAANFLQDTLREVYLEGEAFFDVTHDPNRPFLVHTHELHTRVLGTSFSVHAYPEDALSKVTVASGKVAVQCTLDTLQEVLLPSRQIIYQKEEATWQLEEVNIKQELAWIEGRLIFDHERLELVARTLERYYDVKVIFEDEKLKNCRFSASFQRENIFHILDAMSYINNMEYTFKEGKITLSGKGCTTSN
jgi:ferric-dicitrate binding protein FerR (iron transport regulator)